MQQVTIAGQRIGNGTPTFVIAEAGVNHNGDLGMAKRLIDVAAEAGADAVKFQTFKADRLVTKSAPKAGYQRQTTDAAESQYEMLRRLELSECAHRELMAHCAQRGILFISTPFDEESADFLEALDVPAFKIPSGEVTNLPFLEHVARKGKPIILSTGMSSLGEVEVAVRRIEVAGNRDLVLLHCVSNYPTAPADVNLRAMHTLSAAFGYAVGYSDHTEGNEISVAAVALGATVIEKHFTLDRTLPGPDHRVSLEPCELIAMLRAIRNVEAALGSSIKRPAPTEQDTANVARKSLVLAADLAAGSSISADVLITRRPGTGLPPSARPYVVGRRLNCDVLAGTVLSLEMLS